MWPEGRGSYNKLLQRQNPALVAENQICIFLELGEKVDSSISLMCLIRKVTSVWDVFLEYFCVELTDFLSSFQPFKAKTKTDLHT